MNGERIQLMIFAVIALSVCGADLVHEFKISVEPAAGESAEPPWLSAQAIEPFAGDSLTETEDSIALSTTAVRVCDSLAATLRSWACYQEEGEADATFYRGGAGVTSADGAEYCDACALGPVASGDSKEAFLIAAGSVSIRCICGTR